MRLLSVGKKHQLVPLAQYKHCKETFSKSAIHRLENAEKCLNLKPLSPLAPANGAHPALQVYARNAACACIRRLGCATAGDEIGSCSLLGAL